MFTEYAVNFRPRWGHGKPPHPELYNIIATHVKEYKQFLNKTLEFKEQLWQITRQRDQAKSLAPYWDNGFLPGLDIVSLYTMLAVKKPAQYIEIGSGNSTKVVHKAIKEQGLSTKIISIDPQPRAEIDLLADEIIRVPFENTQLNLAERLAPGDILFIDNSHRILPNSDAMVFFLEVLPRLKNGVIVHLHDNYLPYDYPQFMCDRFYSEQYGLAAFILTNPQRYRTILPDYYISQDHTLSALLAPIWAHPE